MREIRQNLVLLLMNMVVSELQIKEEMKAINSKWDTEKLLKSEIQIKDIFVHTLQCYLEVKDNMEIIEYKLSYKDN